MDSFLFQLPFNGTLHDFKGFQLVSISVSFCDLSVELYTQDLCQVLAAPFVARYIFQDVDIGTGTSFIHCFVERVERLHMFIHSEKVELLYCFV